MQRIEKTTYAQAVGSGRNYDNRRKAIPERYCPAQNIRVITKKTREEIQDSRIREIETHLNRTMTNLREERKKNQILEERVYRLNQSLCEMKNEIDQLEIDYLFVKYRAFLDLPEPMFPIEEEEEPKIEKELTDTEEILSLTPEFEHGVSDFFTQEIIDEEPYSPPLSQVKQKL